MENNYSSIQNFSNTNEIIPFEDNPFFLSDQLSSLDFSDQYSSFNCQWETQIGDSALEPIPLVGSFPIDPLYSSSFHVVPSQGSDSYKIWENEFGVLLNDVEVNHRGEDRQIVLFNNTGQSVEQVESTVNKQCKKRKTTSSLSKLSRKTISSYFYMPITEAAKELNVGLTQLKRRCREVGISRWPHRKLMSLKTLINNVQEMGAVGGEASDSRIREVVELLEKQKKLMEEIPEVELEENTKRLRQAYFKANYKRRKQMSDWELCSESFEYQ
ncbi:Rkd1 [Thalictrum thalictroides]|uniref:Rkd1 n=1 Tax=Thalictrum thalictroides TaxID=46969 RepID=A0A7J6VK58_THATH|nr:Rkd1 [Thalictrum thalictroides]